MPIEIEYSIPNFGGWVSELLERADIKLHKLAIATELTDAYLSRLLNSGKNGKPIRPDPDNVQKVVEGLQKLGLPVTSEEGFIEAGYRVEGYMWVPKTGQSETVASDSDYSPEERAIIEQIRAMKSPAPDPRPLGAADEFDVPARKPLEPGYRPTPEQDAREREQLAKEQERERRR